MNKIMANNFSESPNQGQMTDFREQHGGSASQFITDNLGQVIPAQQLREPACYAVSMQDNSTDVWQRNQDLQDIPENFTDKVANMINFYDTTPQNRPASEVTQSNTGYYGMGSYQEYADYNATPVSPIVSRTKITSPDNRSSSTEHVQDLLQSLSKYIDTATTAIDGLSYNFNQGMKAVFVNLSTQLQQSQPQWSEEEKFVKTEQMCGEEYKTTELQEAVRNHFRTSTNKQNIIETLSQALIQERVSRRMAEHNTEIVKNRLAELHYKGRLLTRCLQALRRNAMDTWKRCYEDTCMKKTDELCGQMRDKCAVSRFKLELQIEQLRKDKLVLQHERTEHEAVIQQAVMRGLCLLNMEALKVLKCKSDIPSPNFSLTSDLSNPATMMEKEESSLTQ